MGRRFLEPRASGPRAPELRTSVPVVRTILDCIGGVYISLGCALAMPCDPRLVIGIARASWDHGPCGPKLDPGALLGKFAKGPGCKAKGPARKLKGPCCKLVDLAANSGDLGANVRDLGVNSRC